MSNKATCPACNAHLSGVYDALVGEAAACPSCGLPGSAIAEIDAAKKRHADAELTAKYEQAVIRAGKAEGELARLRRRVLEVRRLFADWERRDPLDSEVRQSVPWDDD